MRRNVIVLSSLLAAVTLGGLAWAQDTGEDRARRFALRVRAALTRANSTTPEPIKFAGPGKAVATAEGVEVVFDVLDAQGRRGKATFRWRNLLKYRPERPQFAGKGGAVVELPNRTFRFGMRVNGTMRETDEGELVIVGKFRSVRTSVRGAKLRGRFVGKSE